MLILTGQRLTEVTDMSWREIDFDQALWTLPPQRMKGGRAHEVPVASEAMTLLRALPRFAAATSSSPPPAAPSPSMASRG
jgi:integrase